MKSLFTRKTPEQKAEEARVKAETIAQKAVADAVESEVAAKAKLEADYNTSRDDLFTIVEDLIKKPENIISLMEAVNDIKDIAKPNENPVSVLDKFVSVLSSGSKLTTNLANFSYNNKETAQAIARESKFFPEEINKIRKGEEGAENSFFVKILSDPETAKFLQYLNTEVSNDQIVTLITTVPALAKFAEKNGITDEGIKDIAKPALKVLSDALPVVHDLATELLKGEDTGKLISDIKEEKSILKNALKIYDFVNKNEALGKILSKDLPQMLENEGTLANLTKVIDGLIETKFGKEAKLQTGKILDLAKENLPEIMEIADLYNKGKTGAMIVKLIKFPRKKDLLSTVLDIRSKSKSYKDNVKKQKKNAINVEKASKKAEFRGPNGMSRKDRNKVLEVGQNVDKHVTHNPPRSSGNPSATPSSGVTTSKSQTRGG